MYSNSRWLSGAGGGPKLAPLDMWGNWRNKSKNPHYLISRDEGDSTWTKYEGLSVNFRLPAVSAHSTGVSFRPFQLCLFFELHIVNVVKTPTSAEQKQKKQCKKKELEASVVCNRKKETEPH